MGLGMGVGRRGSKAIPTPTPTPIPPPTMGPAGTCKRGRGMELGFVDLDLGGKGVRKGSDPMNALQYLPPNKRGGPPPPADIYYRPFLSTGHTTGDINKEIGDD